MKMNKRTISRLLILAMIFMTIINALSASVSATTTNSVANKLTLYVGEYADVPKSAFRNDYDCSHDSYKFSDPSAVLLNGEAPPDENKYFYAGHGGTMQFVKAGKYTLTISWRIYDGEKMSGSGKIVYSIEVKNRTENKGDVRISYYSDFMAGGKIPTFTVDGAVSDSFYTVKNAYIYYDGQKYYNNIPFELADKEVTLTVLVNPDGKHAFTSSYNYSNWSPTYNMAYVNGERVTQNNVAVYTGNGLRGSQMRIEMPVKIKPYSGPFTEYKGDIKVNYTGGFASGDKFPEFVASDSNICVIQDVWFEHNGAGFHPGDEIPTYVAGKTVRVNIKLSAKGKYRFSYNGEQSDIWSPANNWVYLNGKTIPSEDVSVFSYKDGDTLQFHFDTTIQGAVEEIEITDLDAPVHECELDYSATASLGTVTGVRYEMFRKSITEVRNGDTVSIGVTVKLPEGYSFAEGSYAVWNGQKSDYRIRTSTMETDEYIYVFPYEVGVFGDQAYINSGSVYFMGDAMLKVGARVTDSNYIGSDDAGIIYGEPVWTPAHETFESGQTYVVRIPVSLEKGYVWADDILTNNDFAIASKKAKLVAEETGTSGGKKSYSDKYYLTAAFLPEDINGQGDDKSSAEVDTPVGDYKLDYHDEICVGIVVSSSEEDFSFEVDAENASPDIRFRWYRCDSNGNILDNTVLGNGKALLVYGIKDEDMYKTFYYKCIANDHGNEQSLVFSCILLPEKKDLPFKDVNLGDAFYGNVWYVYSHTPQLMNGISSDSFDPDGNLTRAAIVTVLYRLEGSPAMAASNEFYDVPAGQWYTNAVAWAVKNGITNGYGDGRFGPNDPITREQLAVFLYRYAKSRNIIVPAYGKLNQADASTIDSWALDAMKWAYSKDIIEEVDGRLAPIDNALRHMIATALTRFCVGYSM